MAKSRKRDATETTEFGDLVELDVKKRAAGRAKKAAEHSQHETEDKDWREKLVKLGGTEKERRTRIAALYSDLRIAYDKGELTAKKIRDYLEDFPSSSEYQAFREISEAIHEREARKEGERLRAGEEEEIKFLRGQRLNESERETRKRNKMLREAIGERLGLADFPRQMLENKREQFKTEEWRRALLREYAEGKIDDDDIDSFFVHYSEEENAAYEKLAEEVGVKVKREEIFANKLSREEVEEMLMRGLGIQEKLTPEEEEIEKQVEKYLAEARATMQETIRKNPESRYAKMSGKEREAELKRWADSRREFLKRQNQEKETKPAIVAKKMETKPAVKPVEVKKSLTPEEEEIEKQVEKYLAEARATMQETIRKNPESRYAKMSGKEREAELKRWADSRREFLKRQNQEKETRPAVPEAKDVPSKIEAPPKAETRRTPEERKNIIEEQIAAGKKVLWGKAYKRMMDDLSTNPTWKKRGEAERKKVAENVADMEARTFEENERKKYGI